LRRWGREDGGWDASWNATVVKLIEWINGRYKMGRAMSGAGTGEMRLRCGDSEVDIGRAAKDGA
jgi:hypothetical protein